MKKLSLRELEARSAICGYYPALIEIARESKSPTTAYELSIKNHYGEDSAKACRYLAIIKRDYGKDIFEESIKKIEGKSRKEGILLSLKPFEQTAQRLHYLLELSNSLGVEFGKKFPFSELDEPYLCVVEQLVANIDGLEGKTFFEDMEKHSSLVYIDEARRFARDARNRKFVDRYAVEKTFMVLNRFILFIATLSGISESDLCFRDTINQNYWSHKPRIS